MKNILLSLLSFTVVVIVSYFAITAIPETGYFPMHDDTQVTRVYEMQNVLSDGMFPVRWSENLGYGYGYPIFNFYAPLAYYVGGFLDLYFYDSLTATKVMMAIGVMLAGIFMYFLGKSLWGNAGGVVSAIFYMYAPYHAVNIYVRGAVAETYAYAFVPLAFLGLWKVYTERKWRYVIVGALGLAGVILSHNLTALMIIPFYTLSGLTLMIAGIRTFRSWHWILLPLTGIFALLLSAFYWVPVMSEMHYTNVTSQVGGGADFRDHFVCLMQLWESPWGYGGSTEGCADGMALKIGKVMLLGTGIAFILGVLLLGYEKQKRTVLSLSFLGFLLTIFLMLSYSQIVWEVIPPMAYIQFPWRFLLFASFFASLIIGSLPYALRNLTVKGNTVPYLPFICGILFVSAILFVNLKLFTPQTVYEEAQVDYTDESTIRWEISKISDEYMPKSFEKPKEKADLFDSKITAIDSIPTIEIGYESTTELEAFIETNRSIEVLVNTAYFPAWHIYLNDEEVTYEATNSGMIVPIPPGQHTLLALFEETDVERTANMITLVGAISLLLGIIGAMFGRFL